MRCKLICSSISVWRYVLLSWWVCPWVTLACYWDAKAAILAKIFSKFMTNLLRHVLLSWWVCPWVTLACYWDAKAAILAKIFSKFMTNFHETTQETTTVTMMHNTVAVMDGDDLSKYDADAKSERVQQNSEDKEALEKLEWELASESGRLTGGSHHCYCFCCYWHGFFLSYSYLSHSLADRWGTTADFTTSFLHSFQPQLLLLYYSYSRREELHSVSPVAKQSMWLLPVSPQIRLWVPILWLL